MIAMRTEQIKLSDDKTITVREITRGHWKTTRNESTEFDNEVALIRACTGLEVEAIDELNVPDYNDLKRCAFRLNNPTYEPKAGTAEITVKHAVINMMGERVTLVKINMPKVRAARELSLLTGSDIRVEYMIKATTGLADLDSMPMSDYSLFVLSVPDFFAQGAVYFQQAKLPTS